MRTLEDKHGAAARLAWRRAHPLPDPALWPLLLHPIEDVLLVWPHWPRPPFPPEILPRGAAKAPVVYARVNHGQWQARCPWCPSAQHASPDDPRFYCANCRNETIGQKTVPVRFPGNRAAVEAQLAERPLAEYRNWEPGETVKDLRRQDAEWKAARQEEAGQDG